MDINATFRCSENNSQLMIQCRAEDKISTLLDKFSQKTFRDKKDFDYFYLGKEINEKDKELTIIKLTNNKNIKDIEITINNRNKIFKCPLCDCNNCIIKIKDYRLNFSDCCNGHEIIKLFGEYDDTQRINYQKIRCNNQCAKTQKDSLEEFHKCLKCTQLAGFSIYYCSECSNKHKHKTIKYDEKYYYCEEHFGEFISYCTKCNCNLCEKCEKKHKNHITIKFDAMNPDLNDIKNKLERIGDKIEDLKDVVNFIKEKMDRSIEIIEKYYNIASDMIKKYETFNSKLRNYQTLKTIKYLSTSNKEIITDIENIIKGNKVEDWIVKFTKLLEIVEKDRLVYRNKEFELNDNNTNTSNLEPKNSISYKYEIDSNQEYIEKYSNATSNIPNNQRKTSAFKNCKNKPKGNMIYTKSNVGNK